MEERKTSEVEGTTCPDCLGTGSREGMDCITCGGTGVAPEESVGGG
jgi:DnaJ-class molecular chaperone